MRTSTIVLWFCVVPLGCSSTEGTFKNQPVDTNAVQSNSQQTITMDKDVAIAIAEEAAVKDRGSLEGYNVVPCEGNSFWRILMEPKDTRSNRSGVEYLVSKKGRWIVGQREMPLAVSDEEIPFESREVSREQALAVAKKDAIKNYGSLNQTTKDWDTTQR